MKTLINMKPATNIMNTVELLDVIHSTNHFSANGWSYEYAEKYLFRANGNLVEAGFYTHYADKKMEILVKRVIELPTSYGCPMKCAYCASSCISSISSMTTEILCLITDILINEKGIIDDSEMLIALTGTGDAYYTIELISEYISTISHKYNNLSFTISSCSWTDEMLKKVEKLSLDYRFRNIQSTFISSNEKVVKKLIPGSRSITSGMLDFYNHIKNSSLHNWRINYLMLKSVNDDDDSFIEFLKLIQPISDKVTIRISSLNETIASDSFGLKPAALSRSMALRQLLMLNGINAYLFYSEHNDNMSCGQLVLENELVKSTD